MHNLENIELLPIPLGDIEAKGWLLNQLLLQKKNITGEFEDISPDVKTTGDDRSGWLGGSGESWERGPYYVRGLVYLAYALDDDSLKEKVQKWIDWVIESQIDNGQAGPKAGMPDFDYWAMMPMLIALTEYYDATEDERVIGFLDAYFRFQLDALKKDPLRDWGKARAGDNIYAAKWLYDKTKESYLVDLCNLLYNQADNWKSAYEKGNWGHIVNTHQSFKLFPLMFGMTGDKTYVDTYYSGVRNLFRTSGRIDGMSNGDEMSGDIEATRGTETCAVVEQMFSDIVAFRYLKDPRIGDSLEKVCFNALPSQLTPEITGQVYFTMQNQIEATLGYHGFSSDGGDRSVYGTPGGYPCCIHNFHMGWPLFASNLWFRTSDSGLLAFAYAPNAVKAQVGNNTNVMITQKTNYPFEDSILLKIEADNEETWPLYIRIPSWCDEAEIYVNGDFKGSCKEGSFVRLEAEWKSGDEVKIVLPMKIRTKFMQNNSVGVTYGPLVFCLFIEENWEKISYVSTDWKIPEKYSSYNITPKSNWNYALNLSEGFKVKRKKRYDYDNLVFKSVSVPIEIEAKGAIVESWEYDDRIKGASTLPISPVSEHGKEVKIRLIPYGFARLRASLMPWYGKEKVLYEPDFNVFDTVVAPVDKNDENARLGALPLGKYTGLIRCDVEKDSSIDVLVNGEIVDSVSLYKGEEYFSLPLPIMQNMYNRVEFKGDVSSVKIKSLEFDGKSEVFAYRWEAEHSIVLGNANNRGSHVGGIDKAGDGIAFKIHVSENNMYCFRIYYAAFFGDASHDLFVNGKKAAVVNYKKTDLGWGVFDDETYVEVFVPLTEGTHAISIQKTNLSTGFAEIDAVYVPWQ